MKAQNLELSRFCSIKTPGRLRVTRAPSLRRSATQKDQSAPTLNCRGRLVFISMRKLFLSGAGGGAVHVGIGVDQFAGAALLASPLQVIGYRDVWHAHVESHVLFVGVPAAQ